MFENLIFDLEVTYKELLEYKTDWYNENKIKLLKLVNNDNFNLNSKINITRWKHNEIPYDVLNKKLAIEVKNDIYQYSNNLDGYENWYVNFADGDLFIAYGSKLLAQDEHQVLEHPILANIREFLLTKSKTDSRFDPNTRNYDNKPYFPTPILIKNAKRIFDIDTKPDDINANGIYGKNFALSSFDEILRKTTIINYSQYSNIIAMDAYTASLGFYTKEQIKDLFITAYTAFKAAKNISLSNKVFINTGDWGTGVNGGNKIINALLQLLAALFAEIDLVVFYTSDIKSFNETTKLFEYFTITNKLINIDKIFDKLVQMNFEWKDGDGN